MVEAGAKEVSEQAMLEAILLGHDVIKELIAFQEEIVAAVGQEKFAYTVSSFDETLVNRLKAEALAEVTTAVQVEEKQARDLAINEVISKYIDQYAADDSITEAQLAEVSGVLNKFVKDRSPPLDHRR